MNFILNRLYKGSIINCLLIEELYEWINEIIIVSKLLNEFKFLVKILKFSYGTIRPYRIFELLIMGIFTNFLIEIFQ